MADAGWKAQWIWAEEADAGMVLARTVFALKEEPQSAHLRITATSVYKLYVNGEYIARGPARCAPHNQSYDTFDVKNLLRQGSNSIAVRVHYQEGTVSHHLPGRGGLLAQLDVFKGDEPFTIATGNGWKLLPDPSWNPASPKMSRFHLELCDRVDLRKSPGNWTGVAFDDASWPAAKVLVRTVGWPGQQDDARATALTLPWIHLEKRDIPYLVERDIPATELIQAHPLDSAASGPKGLIRNMPLTGEVDDDYAEGCDVGGWFLLYDFGRVVNGLPILDIEGPAGTVVDVMCAPYIVDESFTANIVDSQLVDRITLSGERDQWEATYFKPARYMGILIRNADGPVKQNGAGSHERA
jgi:hypothetical protein